MESINKNKYNFEDWEESSLHLIEAVKRMTISTREYIEILNQVLEVLKNNYGDE